MNLMDYLKACEGVYLSGRWSMGEMVSKLEHEFSRHLESRGVGDKKYHCLATTSGTMALFTILNYLNLPKGSKVLVPSFTFTASALPLLAFDLQPVFVDVTIDTFTIDPEQVYDELMKDEWKRIKAIIAVDIDGRIPDFEALENARQGADRQDVVIIEDAAPAHGSSMMDKPAGTFGDISFFSLNQTKLVSSGEGGLIVSSNQDAITKMRSLIYFGERIPHRIASRFRESIYMGFNLQMSELQAVLGLLSLQDWSENIRLAWENALALNRTVHSRADIFDRYIRQNYGAPQVFVLHKYRARLKEKGMRTYVEDMLEAEGVPISRQEIAPLHTHPVFTRYATHRSYPITDYIHSQTIIIGDRQNTLWETNTSEVARWKNRINNLPTYQMEVL